jgi:purine nucleosidase
LAALATIDANEELIMSQKLPLSHEEYLHRLRLPNASTQPLRIVIDTDAANEIDDQFALAWALRSPKQLQVEAIYATPFSFAHRRSLYPQASPNAVPFNSPDVGMQRSFDEIVKVQTLLGLKNKVPSFRGSPAYLASLDKPIASETAAHLISTALAMPFEEPLYVVALGCVTNIASALLLAPEIARKIVVVWTSGFPSHAPHTNHSFNLEQDLLASQWLLDSGVPLVYLPGYHVGAQLRLSLAEMERYVQPCGEIGRYLHFLFTNNPLWPILGQDGSKPHSWVIWDVINIAWLLNPAWVPSEIVCTPRLGDDKHWQPDASRHPMREAHAVQRDAIFNDFFEKLKT